MCARYCSDDVNIECSSMCSQTHIKSARASGLQMRSAMCLCTNTNCTFNVRLRLFEQAPAHILVLIAYTYSVLLYITRYFIWFVIAHFTQPLSYWPCLSVCLCVLCPCMCECVLYVIDCFSSCVKINNSNENNM